MVPCVHDMMVGEEDDSYCPDRERLAAWRSSNTASPAELWAQLFRFYRSATSFHPFLRIHLSVGECFFVTVQSGLRITHFLGRIHFRAISCLGTCTRSSSYLNVNLSFFGLFWNFYLSKGVWHDNICLQTEVGQKQGSWVRIRTHTDLIRQAQFRLMI